MVQKTRKYILVGKDRVEAARSAKDDDDRTRALLKGRASDLDTRLFEATDDGSLKEMPLKGKTVVGISIGKKAGEPEKQPYSVSLEDASEEMEVHTTGRKGKVVLSDADGETEYELLEDIRSTIGDQLQVENIVLQKDLKAAARINDPTQSLKQMSRTLLDAVNDRIGFEGATLILTGTRFSTEEEKYVERYSLGKDAAGRTIVGTDQIHAGADSTIIDSIIEGRTITTKDYLREGDHNLLGKKMSAFSVIPLTVGTGDRKQTVGALVVDNSSKQNHISKSDVSSIEYLAGHAAGEVLSSKLSEIDFITGLLTRNSFIEHYEKELANSLLRKTPLTAAVTDLDRFKPIVEAFGHLNGSRVIKQIGTLIYSNLDPIDQAGALGGDEMMMLFVSGKEQSIEKADRVRKAIEKHRFEVVLDAEQKDDTIIRFKPKTHGKQVIKKYTETVKGKEITVIDILKGSEVRELDDGSRVISLAPGTITMSIGMASMPEDVRDEIGPAYAASREELEADDERLENAVIRARRAVTRKADATIDMAKKQGRNCVKVPGMRATRDGKPTN